jgi:hypothetical protein
MKSTISLKLPNDLRERVQKQAIESNLPVEQYIVYLLTKIISYQDAQDELRKMMKRKNRAKALSVLEKVPDRPPLKGDELPRRGIKRQF